MNIFTLLYILILLSIIIYNSINASQNRSSLIETFENKTKNNGESNVISDSKNNGDIKNIIILLGDSILKNNSYVKPGFSIEELLDKRLQNNKSSIILNYAENDGTIRDVYRQLETIPFKYTDVNNKYNIKLFLSIGGNNLLNTTKENVIANDSIQNNNEHKLLNLFDKYEYLINAIKAKFPFSNSELFLLNIYYPYANNDKDKDNNTNYKISELYEYIRKWNNLLNDYIEKNKNNSIELINIADTLKNKDDFTFVIEPSEKGGQKIVNLIASKI